MFRVLVFLAAMTSPFWALSQKKNDEKSFNFHGQVYELDLKDSTEKGLMKIPIEVWSGDELIATIETGPKGKYNISLPHYPTIRLKFGKSPYITKIIDIDADGFRRAAEFGLVNLDLDVSLFKDNQFIGMDFMNYTPVAIARFNKKKGTLEWDMNYAQQINNRVNGILEANGR